MKSLSCVRLFANPWTVAYHAPPPMGRSRQENWSGLPFPSPDLKAKRCIFTCLKDFSVNAGDTRDMGWISVLERSPGGGNGNLLQYSCVENPMDRGAWWVTIHGITKSQTQLN